MEYVKGTQKSTERTPDGQNWNNSSNNINNIVLNYNLIYKKSPWIHTDINKWGGGNKQVSHAGEFQIIDVEISFILKEVKYSSLFLKCGLK